jgi:hypothetical protein
VPKEVRDEIGAWAIDLSKYQFGKDKHLISSKASYAILDSTENGLGLLEDEFDMMVKHIMEEKKQYKVIAPTGKYPYFDQTACKDVDIKDLYEDIHITFQDKRAFSIPLNTFTRDAPQGCELLIMPAPKDAKYIRLGLPFLTNFYSTFKEHSDGSYKIGLTKSVTSLGSIKDIDHPMSGGMVFLIILIVASVLAIIGFLAYKFCWGKDKKVNLKTLLKKNNATEEYVSRQQEDRVLLAEDKA